MRYRVAVDVGGTFTDLVALELATGHLSSAKVPSLPGAPGRALENALGETGIAAGEIETFFHGTTFGLNIVLERKGADVALITTAGFRDVLEIARATWPMYRLHWRPPPPLVPRNRRLEVRERVSSGGRILVPLEEADVRAALGAVRVGGIEAVAVCLVNAYTYTAHEERIAEICAAEFPELSCTVSHAVSRDYREYERSVTTVVEAMIAARMRQYFTELESFFKLTAVYRLVHGHARRRWCDGSRRSTPSPSANTDLRAGQRCHGSVAPRPGQRTPERAQHRYGRHEL